MSKRHPSLVENLALTNNPDAHQILQGVEWNKHAGGCKSLQGGGLWLGVSAGKLAESISERRLAGWANTILYDTVVHFHSLIY